MGSLPHVPRTNRLESIAVIIAIALSPLWFILPFGVNLSVFDIVFIIAFLSYVIRTSSILLPPSRLLALGIVFFLIAGAFGTAISPFPASAVLDYLQYHLIFIIVIPITYIATRDWKNWWYSALGLYTFLNCITVITVIVGLTTHTPIGKISLLYNNQNQLFWLIASSALLNYCIIWEKFLDWRWRLVSTIFTLGASILVLLSLSITSILMLCSGGWLITIWNLMKLRQLRKKLLIGFSIANIIILFIGSSLVLTHWETVRGAGSVPKRIAMYSLAYEQAIQVFPLGAGFGSSQILLNSLPEDVARSIHNWFLAYLLELGIFGVVGFTLILSSWFHGVFVRSISVYRENLSSLSFSPIPIFGAYIIVMSFQPVPVRRFWWVLFALSWASIWRVRKNTG